MASAEPTPERWEYRAQTNDYRCRVHECEFERGEVCFDCTEEPSGPPSLDLGDESEHDQELSRREAEWRARSKKLARIADELLEGTDRDCAAAAKLIAESTKLERMAAENRVKRARVDRVKQMRRERLRMRGGSN